MVDKLIRLVYNIIKLRKITQPHRGRAKPRKEYIMTSKEKERSAQ